MRRIVVLVALVAVAIVLLLVLRQRKREFVAAQVELLQSDDSQEATDARKRLQRVGRSAVRPVCALLEHEDEEVRARAALTLANIGHAAACGPLMEAAKRGDLPAADALESIKHPRAAEARAWVWCRLGDEAFEELKLRLPIGGRPPTEPCGFWSQRRQPFEPMRRERLMWPAWGWGLWRLRDISSIPSEAEGLIGAPPRFSVHRCYKRSLDAHPLAEAFTGLGRLHELLGRYAVAAASYGQALELRSQDESLQRAKARAEHLAALVREMNAFLPRGDNAYSVLSHPSWRQGDATYHVAVTAPYRTSVLLRREAATTVLFERRGDRLRKADEAGIFVLKPEAWRNTYACVDLVSLDRGRAAAVAVIADTAPRAGSRDYRLTLYGVGDGALVKTLELPSVGPPCVTDLDDDGEAELITWRWALFYPSGLGASVLWPIVRTRVDGRYEVRTEQFPSLFGPIAEALADREKGYARQDPKPSDWLGRAYEILGEQELALAAYQRAERKYLASAQRAATTGSGRQVRRYQRGAADVRERRLRLEGGGES